jgi:signal peptidase II
MKRSVKIFLFCLSAVAFISCDRVTKTLAKEHLMNSEPLSYFHDTFRLEYVENTGAALSLGDALPSVVSFWLLSIIPLIFLLLLFGYTIKNSANMNFMKVFSLALIFSGGMGNVIDRILFDRHVTDFMNMGIQNLRTGIFNFADMCVTGGAIGLLIFFRDKKVAVKTATTYE